MVESAPFLIAKSDKVMRSSSEYADVLEFGAVLIVVLFMPCSRPCRRDLCQPGPQSLGTVGPGLEARLDSDCRAKCLAVSHFRIPCNIQVATLEHTSDVAP